MVCCNWPAWICVCVFARELICVGGGGFPGEAEQHSWPCSKKKRQFIHWHCTNVSSISCSAVISAVLKRLFMHSGLLISPNTLFSFGTPKLISQFTLHSGASSSSREQESVLYVLQFIGLQTSLHCVLSSPWCWTHSKNVSYRTWSSWQCQTYGFTPSRVSFQNKLVH